MGESHDLRSNSQAAATHRHPQAASRKPQAKGEFILKGRGSRRGEQAIVYYIPNHTNPKRPYEKGITESEFEAAYNRLHKTGELSSRWFHENMPGCAKEGSCNFTTIGGFFQILGVAEYQRGVYRKVQQNSDEKS